MLGLSLLAAVPGCLLVVLSISFISSASSKSIANAGDKPLKEYANCSSTSWGLKQQSDRLNIGAVKQLAASPPLHYCRMGTDRDDLS